jgi:hypothetical protein
MGYQQADGPSNPKFFSFFFYLLYLTGVSMYMTYGRIFFFLENAVSMYRRISIGVSVSRIGAT